MTANTSIYRFDNSITNNSITNNLPTNNKLSTIRKNINKGELVSRENFVTPTSRYQGKLATGDNKLNKQRLAYQREKNMVNIINKRGENNINKSSINKSSLNKSCLMRNKTNKTVVKSTNNSKYNLDPVSFIPHILVLFLFFIMALFIEMAFADDGNIDIDSREKQMLDVAVDDNFSVSLDNKFSNQIVNDSSLNLQQSEYIKEGRRIELDIAIHDLNRIVFSCGEIVINTVSQADITVDNGSIFVRTDTMKDVHLFISPEQEPYISFLVILHPKKIVPQNIVLNIDMENEGVFNLREKYGQTFGLENNDSRTNFIEHELRQYDFMQLSNVLWAGLIYLGIDADIKEIHKYLRRADSSIKPILDGDSKHNELNEVITNEEICGENFDVNPIHVWNINDANHLLLFARVDNKISADLMLECDDTKVSLISYIGDENIEAFRSMYAILFLNKREIPNLKL